MPAGTMQFAVRRTRIGDRSRPGGPHRRTGPFGASEDPTLPVADDDGRVRAAGVDAEQDGRTFRRPDGRIRHAGSCGRPAVRPSGRPTSDEIIPTTTVTRVPSGTYQGHASPGSQCTGTCGITAPSTTGDMRTTLTAIATITSIWRARGQAPPRMYVPSRLP